MQQMPSVSKKSSLRVHACWRHHERCPGIREQEKRGSENVGQDADGGMNPFQTRLRH
jgi:hypothetical protein